MGRSLRLLERSVARGCKPKQHPTEGMTSLGSLQEQIAVVRGQHAGQPTGAMRALEHRVLGHPAARSSLIPTYIERETLRLDQEQLAPTYYAPVSNAQVTSPGAPSLPTPAVALATSVAAYSSAYYQARDDHSSAYAPEFSAPDTGRFQVESFADDLFDIGRDHTGGAATDLAMPDFSIPPINANSNTGTPNAGTPHLGTSNTGAPNAVTRMPAVVPSRAPAATPVFDDDNWISAAQHDRPAKITAASKQALNPGLALAKDDFERELAAILGTEAVVAPAAPAADPLFNPNAATQPVSNPSASNPPISNPSGPAKPAAESEVAHPNHSVFDQMGLAMRYANSFDLGNVSLKNRFDHFEQELDVDRQAPHQSKVQVQSITNPFVDPMNLDEFDLVAELAEIGVENPVVARQAPQVQSPQSQAPQSDHTSVQPTPLIEPIPNAEAAPIFGAGPSSDTAASAKPVANQDPNHITPKPINRTETTAGDDHE